MKIRGSKKLDKIGGFSRNYFKSLFLDSQGEGYQGPDYTVNFRLKTGQNPASPVKIYKRRVFKY